MNQSICIRINSRKAPEKANPPRVDKVGEIENKTDPVEAKNV